MKTQNIVGQETLVKEISRIAETLVSKKQKLFLFKILCHGKNRIR